MRVSDDAVSNVGYRRSHECNSDRNVGCPPVKKVVATYDGKAHISPGSSLLWNYRKMKSILLYLVFAFHSLYTMASPVPAHSKHWHDRHVELRLTSIVDVENIQDRQDGSSASRFPRMTGFTFHLTLYADDGSPTVPIWCAGGSRAHVEISDFLHDHEH